MRAVCGERLYYSVAGRFEAGASEIGVSKVQFGNELVRWSCGTSCAKDHDHRWLNELVFDRCDAERVVEFATFDG